MLYSYFSQIGLVLGMQSAIMWHVELFLLFIIIAALAIGDTATAEGYLCELQPGLELHKPGTKPEPCWSKEKKSNPKN